MTDHQFFIKQSQIEPNNEIKLDGSDARHIRVVLRLRRGSSIRLVDENQNLYLASIRKVTGREVCASISESIAVKPKPARLCVVQGIPRLPKADLIVQKLTELGAGKIVFTPVDHSSYKDAFDRIRQRLPRLGKIAEAAAKQCGRLDIPNVLACDGLRNAVKKQTATLMLVANEKTGAAGLRDLLAGASEKTLVTVFIGPEGGLSESETSMLEKRGAKSFSLGRNILRTETAAIVAASLILYELGEI